MRKWKRGALATAASLIAVLIAGAVIAQNVNVYTEQGGDRMVVGSGGSLDVASGGEIDIESGGSLKIAGTAISSTAAELNEYSLSVELDTLCTASSAWVVAPHAGDVVKIYTVIDGAIATSDVVITPQIGGTNITNGAITVANASSAAGDVDSSTPTAANTVTAGQAIEFETDGACVNAIKTEISVLISR